MLIKPHELIRGLNSDTILINYNNNYFNCVSSVLNNLRVYNFFK
jgi:hypothetical protein